MSIAAVAAQQSAAQQAAALTLAADNAASGVSTSSTASASTTSTSTASSSTASTAPQNALTQLSGNFQDFLSMLMTQLQNQDPSSPMDANTFTNELVEFSGVEQQINTNQSLTQLIQLTQSGEILQSSSMIGHQVDATSDHMPVQNGAGQIDFTAAAAGPTAIAVYNDAGAKLADATVQATAGQNTWKWNATASDGTTVPDGSYRVAVMQLDASGNPTAVPFDVVGTATGVTNTNNSLMLSMGSLSVPFTSVQSIVPTTQ